MCGCDVYAEHMLASKSPWIVYRGSVPASGYWRLLDAFSINRARHESIQLHVTTV
jgi:hypothetical protein